ncbi:MAG: anti-sigma factor family protein [Thermoanaerobaculia bacterium]
MSADRPQTFDETLLSGYLDGELTQAEEQRVRIRLENDPQIRRLLEEMRAAREATMTTEFQVPEDIQWDERPRGLLSRLLRNTGWGLFLLWVGGIAGFALWQFLRSPESMWMKLFAVAGISGLAVLLLSFLLDRLRDLETDRYRRVRR